MLITAAIRTLLLARRPHFSRRSPLSFLAKAWNDTFPDEETNARRKFEQQREEALARKKTEEEMLQLTQEQLAEFQKTVPEWKKGSLVLREAAQKKESQGLKDKILGSEGAKRVLEWDKVKEIRKEYSEFKEDFKSYVQSSESVVVQSGSFVYSKLTGSNLARATLLMREVQPDFDMYELEKEASTIFKTIYDRYLAMDQPFLDGCSADQALGYFSASIKVLTAQQRKPKFQNLLTVEGASLQDAVLGEKGLPVFVLRLKAQEVYCLQDKGGKVVDGDESRVVGSQFQFGLRQSDRGLHLSGFAWEIVSLHKLMEIKMLV